MKHKLYQVDGDLLRFGFWGLVAGVAILVIVSVIDGWANAIPANRALQGKSVAALVKAAKKDVADLRITRPAGNNAAEKLLEIQRREPQHIGAQVIRTKAAGIYLAKAERTLKSNRFKKTLAFLIRARQVDPLSPRLAELEKQLYASAKWPAPSVPTNRSSLASTLAAFWLAGGASGIICGFFLRSRKAATISIWNLIEQASEVTTQDLSRSTGYGADEIRRAVRLINVRGGAYFVWDQTGRRLFDGRLRVQFAAVAQCESCGAAVNEQVRLDLEAGPGCTYCGAPVIKAGLNELKMKALRELRGSPMRATNNLSGTLFILLAVLFWPLAIYLALREAGIIGMDVSAIGTPERS
jgi:hypothetical protein